MYLADTMIQKQVYSKVQSYICYKLEQDLRWGCEIHMGDTFECIRL